MPASKSAYIAALGVVVQFLAGFAFAKSIPVWAGLGGIVAVMVGVVMMLLSLPGLILVLLFWFRRTTKFAAVLSIIFGIAGILSKAGIFGGVIFLLAGILHLWKKF